MPKKKIKAIEEDKEKIDRNLIKQRISELEKQVNNVNNQILQATRIKLSLQGGIIELRRLLESNNTKPKER